MKLYHQFINILNKKEKNYVLIIIFLTIFVSLLEMIGIGLVPTFLYGIIEPDKFLGHLPEFIKNLIEPFIFKNTIIFFLLVAFIIFIIKNFFLLISNYLIINFRGNIREGIINRTNQYYNSMNYIQFLRYNSSTIIRNITTESQNTSSVLRDISFLFNELLIVFFIIILNFLINFEITLITLLILIIPSIFYFFFTKKILKRIGAQNVDIRAKLIKTINHTIGSFKENLIQKKIPFLQNYFRNILSKEITNTKKYNFFSVIPKILFELVAITVIVLAVFILKIDEKTVIDKLPNLSLFLVSLIKLMPCISRISTHVTKIVYNLKSVDVINDLSSNLKNNKIVNKINQSDGTNDFKFLNKIEFKNISFGYSENNHVLENINLELYKNQKILIRGASGAGKSTLIDLILGLIKPNKGQIEINGKKIETIIDQWQKKISLLPQKVFLLEDSIKNNIIFGNTNISNQNQKIKEIIKDTNLNNLINKLQNGIETKISEMGKNLSGGEMQRIALARSVFRDSELLVCDEPTTGLDDENINIIMKILNNLAKEKMLIIISHEKNLEKICDIIIEIKDKNAKIITK